MSESAGSESSNRDTRPSLLEIASLLLILLLALFLRVYYLDQESPWYDEVITLEHLDAPTLSAYLERVKGRNSPVQPLYLILEYGWSRVFGIEPVAIRWLSVLFGLGAVGLTHLIGRRLGGVGAGLLAAFGVAVSQTHVVYAQEIRMYPMVLLLGLASIYILLRIIDGGGKGWWIAHFSLTVLMVWTHVFAAFILPVQTLIMWGFGLRLWKPQALWLGGHILACSTIAVWFMGMSTEGVETAITWLKAPTFWPEGSGLAAPYSVVSTLSDWLMLTWESTPIMMWINALLVAVPLGGWGYVGYRILRQRIGKIEPDSLKRDALGWFLLTGMWVIPVLMLYALSHLWRPTLVPRYILISSVAPYLLIGLAWSHLSRYKAKWIYGLIVVILGAVQSAYILQHPMRMPWTQALDEVIRRDESPYSIRLIVISESIEIALRYQYSYYLDEYEYNMEVYFSGDTLLQELQAQTDWDRPVHVMLIGSMPSEVFDQFLRESGLTANVSVYPSQQPLTLYRITKPSG